MATTTDLYEKILNARVVTSRGLRNGLGLRFSGPLWGGMGFLDDLGSLGRFGFDRLDLDRLGLDRLGLDCLFGRRRGGV